MLAVGTVVVYERMEGVASEEPKESPQGIWGKTPRSFRAAPTDLS